MNISSDSDIAMVAAYRELAVQLKEYKEEYHSEFISVFMKKHHVSKTDVERNITASSWREFHTEDAYRQLACDLNAALAKEQGKIRQTFENLHGVSSHTVYRNLKKVGWKSGRKKRKDAGTSAVSEKVLCELEAMTRQTFRATGKQTMPTTVAASVLATNGREISVSNSRLNQLRRERKTTSVHQGTASPHQRLRSLHPNHVHQVDPSYCLLYYAPNGDQVVQKFIDESEMYANKPENLEKIKNLKCWRYVLTDHYSGSIMVRYYQSAGETSANLWDFLLYCWKNLDSRPFRGVPDIMVWDKGSANTSSAIKNALAALQVEAIAHMAKNPRAKGQVESSNNIVECHFESRLKFEPVNSVDELNAAVEAWYNAWNANLIPRQDTRLNRLGMPKPIARYDLWQTILRMPHKLRELPPMEVCRYLLTSKPKSCQIDGHLEVSFKHPAARSSSQYTLRECAGVSVGDKVMVSPLYYGNCQVMVTIVDHLGQEMQHVLEPRDYNDAGFAVDAPVWGEDIQSMPDTVVETRNKAADLVAYPDMTLEEIKKAKAKQVTPFNGELNAHSHLKDIKQPTFMRKTGVSIDLTGQFQPEERKPLGRIALKRLVVNALGRGLEPHESEMLSQHTNAFDEDVPNLVEQLLQGTLPQLQLVK
ncbi:MAG: DDE-type integrase/transposase/recombinase [Gammaproteobacteria bacterium]|nr:DDE-type integrase/transposase/recombinase [Gammaproteobacteria bacterium]